MGGGTGKNGLILVDTVKMTGCDLPIPATPGWVEFDPKSDKLVVLTPGGITLFDRDGAQRDRCRADGLDVQRIIANPRGGEYVVWFGSRGPVVCRRVKE